MTKENLILKLDIYITKSRHPRSCVCLNNFSQTAKFLELPELRVTCCRFIYYT